MTGSESESITNAIVDMVVKDYVPLSIVEAEGFQKLMKTATPNYSMPSRNTIRARINKRYGDEKASLVERLKNVSGAAITTDTWTSTSCESFITVTEHHITDDWEMDANVLLTRAMPERHTGKNLANRLKECVSEFELTGKINACVHDNARNMEAAGDICEEWTDIGCFGHTFQLCIKPVFDIPQVSKTVSRCRKLVGHFKHSTTVTAEFRRRQPLLNVPQHELVQDESTRWNSTQAMMERLYEQRRVIMDIMLDENVTKKADTGMLLKDEEWDTICDLSVLLKNFADTTTYLCEERDMS